MKLFHISLSTNKLIFLLVSEWRSEECRKGRINFTLNLLSLSQHESFDVAIPLQVFILEKFYVWVKR